MNDPSNTKSVAYKTVDTFAGICRKKLWLKNGKEAVTDGYMLTAPFEDPWFYRRVELLLGHTLFRSDFVAQHTFVADYARRITHAVHHHGGRIEQDELHAALNHVVNVLDARRVTSLWGRLYRGSKQQIQEMRHHDVSGLLDEWRGDVPVEPAEMAHSSLLTLLSALEGGIDVPDGRLSRYILPMREALQKVQNKSFYGGLVIAKWLITQLVDELIRKDRGEPPPDEGDEGQSQGLGGGDAQEDTEGDEQDNDSAQSKQGGSSYNPEAPQCSARDRVRAMQELVKEMGNPPQDLQRQAQSLKRPKYKRFRDQEEGQATARQAIQEDVKDIDKLEDSLQDSTQDMEDLVEEARQALRQQMTKDDWLRKGAFAKVMFRDLRREDFPDTTTPLEHEDHEAVRRMRSLFTRIMGRRTTKLQEYGDEIDIDAYIEGRMVGELLPCFRHEVRGQGFRVLLLVDRSGSMAGPKTQAVQRAVRILQKALKFPFVTFNMWGFQSNEDGQVDVTRYAPDVPALDCARRNISVGGCTPLHAALSLGMRSLEEGSDTKQLIVLTDGFPTFFNRQGKPYSTGALMAFVRKRVREGWRTGINTTALMVGERGYGDPRGVVYYDLEPKQLAYMFGPKRNWKRVDPIHLGRDLIAATTASFISYLSGR